MNDKERVIKALNYLHDREKWREGIMIHDDHAEVRKKIASEAINLLKDQPEIVRCKDCKHRDPEDKRCDSGCLFNNHDYIMPDEWYCAAGERK